MARATSCAIAAAWKSRSACVFRTLSQPSQAASATSGSTQSQISLVRYLFNDTRASPKPKRRVDRRGLDAAYGMDRGDIATIVTERSFRYPDIYAEGRTRAAVMALQRTRHGSFASTCVHRAR